MVKVVPPLVRVRRKPSSLTAGTVRVTVDDPGEFDFAGVVLHVVAGSTWDEAWTFLQTNPTEQPAMIDDYDVVTTAASADELASPALIELVAGEYGLLCVTADGRFSDGGSLTVTDS